MTAAQQVRIERVVLQLNKAGLSYLKIMKYNQARQFLKKAQRIIQQQLALNDSVRVSQLAGVTFNNLACYYKKTNKPKVALAYLHRSLQLEVYKVEDWVSAGSTHLNICAIYSFMGRHQDAIAHVQLALNLLQKATFSADDNSEEAKSFWNIKMLSYYNKAIQLEYLKQYPAALQSYRMAQQVTKYKNTPIVRICQEAAQKIQTKLSNQKKNLLSTLLRKKDNYQAGHYDYIRHNKKNALKEEILPPKRLLTKFAKYRSVTVQNQKPIKMKTQQCQVEKLNQQKLKTQI